MQVGLDTRIMAPKSQMPQCRQMFGIAQRDAFSVSVWMLQTVVAQGWWQTVPYSTVGLGMHDIKKCPTIICRVKKYHDTSIPWYFVTYRRQLMQKSYRANNLQCSHRFSVPYNVNAIRCKHSASGHGCQVVLIYVGVLMYTADLIYMQWFT